MNKLANLELQEIWDAYEDGACQFEAEKQYS